MRCFQIDGGGDFKAIWQKVIIFLYVLLLKNQSMIFIEVSLEEQHVTFVGYFFDGRGHHSKRDERMMLNWLYLDSKGMTSYPAIIYPSWESILFKANQNVILIDCHTCLKVVVFQVRNHLFQWSIFRGHHLEQWKKGSLSCLGHMLGMIRNTQVMWRL